MTLWVNRCHSATSEKRSPKSTPKTTKMESTTATAAEAFRLPNVLAAKDIHIENKEAQDCFREVMDFTKCSAPERDTGSEVKPGVGTKPIEIAKGLWEQE